MLQRYVQVCKGIDIYQSHAKGFNGKKCAKFIEGV